MKSLTRAMALATLIFPIVSFAQSNGPITRAQVRAELVQLESTGWRPGAGSDPHYPDDVQAAEAKVAKMNSAASGYGGSASGTSSAGQVQTGQMRDVEVSSYSPPIYRYH